MAADVTSPWTDQAYLTSVQYPDDSNLSARQSIYAYQQPRIDLARSALDLACLNGDEVVVDVGCGNGGYLVELVRRGHKGAVFGVDLSLGMLQSTRRILATVPLVTADVGALPMPDQSVDVAFAMHMLYHARDPFEAVRELGRVTRTRGRVLVILNGSDHLQELRALVARAIGSSEQAPGTLIGRLRLDEGESLLGNTFASVVRHDFIGELVVTDPSPIRSLREEPRSGEAFIARR